MQTKQLLFGLVCFSMTFALNAATNPSNSKPSYTVSTKPSPTTKKKTENEEIESCDLENPASFRFSTLHREAKGIGYNQGYTSFNGFFAFKSIENWHPYFDIRTHFFNDWRVAANAGFGIRYQPNSVKAIFGANGFFDYRNTGHSTFEQAGAGFEALGAKWFGRINGYFPIISKNYLYDVEFTGFNVNNALFAVKRDLAFKGYDISLGRTLIQRQYYSLSSTLAGYMFFADYNKTAKGGLLKLDADISRYFAVQFQTSYDSLFKGIVQGQLALNLPFGKKIKARKKGLSCSIQNALANRLTEKVDRFEIIVTDKYVTQSIAKNPDTGENLFIVFVDNTLSGGDGTAENPYSTLSAAENNSLENQMIYVYGGTSTTTGMDTGITLKNKQWLQGSGISFIALTEYGLDNVPAQTTNWPTIGNTLGNTITLADDNTIMGLNIIASNNAIYGFNTSNVKISYNNCAGAPLSDFNLDNPSGNIVISHNNSRSANGLTLTTTKNATLNIQNNIFRNQGAKNLDLTFRGTSNSTASLRFNDFLLSTTGSTIATQNSARLTLNLQENTFDKMQTTADYAVQFSASSLSNMVAVLLNNETTGPTLKGFDFLTTDSATSFFYVEDNTGTYSGSEETAFPFTFTVNSFATTNLLLEGNIANSTGYHLSNNSALATFNVQSPSLSLSGLESINTGTFTIDGSGTITYISYTPSSTPDLN
jgi:hypothetical protein